MKISRFLLAGGLMLGSLSNTLPAQSQAEPPITPAPAPVEGIKAHRTYTIPVKNVAPHMLAWWLAPVNQPSPPEFGKPLPQQPEPAPRTGAFALPAGVERIIPVDAQKVLLVMGTQEGVQELGKTVAFLDQPLRYVEIETHVVPMSREDIKAFGLDFGLPPVNQAGEQIETGSATSVGFSRFRGDLSALLAARGDAGPLSEIKLPRVLALNNLSASLDASRSYPAPAELENRVKALAPQNGASAPLEVQTPLKITLTPTINNDDTVTLLVDLMGQMQLGRKGAPDALKLAEPSAIKSIMNAKDGETLVIRGFNRNFTSAFLGGALSKTLMTNGSDPVKIPILGDVPHIGNLFRSRSSASTEIVVFLTPRIVRRVNP